MHVDKSFTKIQARVRPPPIQAMPEFWEHLVLAPLPYKRYYFFGNLFHGSAKEEENQLGEVEDNSCAQGRKLILENVYYYYFHNNTNQSNTCESLGPLLLTAATTIDKTMFITKVRITFKEAKTNVRRLYFYKEGEKHHFHKIRCTRKTFQRRH